LRLPSLASLIALDQQELENIDNNLPDPEEQNIRYRLMKAYSMCLERQIVLMKEIENFSSNLRGVPSQAEKQRVEAIRFEIGRLHYEADELGDYIFEHRTSPLDALGDGGMGDLLQTSGYNFSEILNLLDRAHANKKLRAGRPTTRTFSSVKALELQRRAKLNMIQIANQICDCGAQTHDAKCADRLGKGIKKLEKLLAKYQL
jgi:hypothetical protein